MEWNSTVETCGVNSMKQHFERGDSVYELKMEGRLSSYGSIDKSLLFLQGCLFLDRSINLNSHKKPKPRANLELKTSGGRNGTGRGGGGDQYPPEAPTERYEKGYEEIGNFLPEGEKVQSRGLIVLGKGSLPKRRLLCQQNSTCRKTSVSLEGLDGKLQKEAGYEVELTRDCGKYAALVKKLERHGALWNIVSFLGF